MAHGLNPIIKREIECGGIGSSNSVHKSSSVVGNSIAQPNSNSSSSTASSNARMGSRRIFTPQFKLQVLESYRNDNDCKGNQRATARKYGIHRRQIQKWLQCEAHLRASVANLNQNNVKHQFHNISHHQMRVSSPSSSSSSAAVAAANTHANIINNNNQSQSYKATSALDTARHSVALAATTSCSSASSSPSVATVRLLATTNCMNGSIGSGTNLTIQSTPATNTISIHQPYNHTPAIQMHQPQPSMPLIQHHHQHHQHQNLHHQHENVLMPSACLPLPVLPGSPVPIAANRANELRDYQPIGTTRNCYNMTDDYNCNRAQPIYENLQFFNSVPIDLSVGPRRHQEIELRQFHPLPISLKSEPAWQDIEDSNNNDTGLKIKTERVSISPSTIHANSTQAVDLTCRKRANYNPNETSPPEKVQKSNNEAASAEEAVAKPVKLFKPYLLDDEDDTGKKSTNDQIDPIIWSNHPAAVCLTSPSYDTQSPQSSNFPSTADPTYTFPIGSPNSSSSRFQNSPTTSIYDCNTPPTAISIPWCPKGSPVSGYDTASTYSNDSGEYQHQHSRNQYNQQSPFRNHTSYSLDLKMQAIDSYYHDLTCRGDQLAVAGKFNVHRNEVQRWLDLDQEANIRQGIALYV